MNEQIAYITDLHLEEQFPKDEGVDAQANWKVILDDLKKKKIVKVIFGGDIGEATSNQWFFESLKDYELEITLGNHDQFSAVKEHYRHPYQQSDQELYYSKQDDRYKHIFLDSSAGSISRKQYKWLQSELKTDKKILLFIHHPILPVETEADRQFALEGRNELKKLLHQSGLDVIIFCGHYHLADMSVDENIQQYITPAGSVQILRHEYQIILDGSTFGYRIINLAQENIRTELVMFNK